MSNKEIKDILGEMFESRQEKIENKIFKIYQEKIKNVTIKEKDSAKTAILNELYYKEGFMDGINLILQCLNKDE